MSSSVRRSPTGPLSDPASSPNSSASGATVSITRPAASAADELLPAESVAVALTE